MEPKRVLGLLDGVNLVAGSMLGIGIFLTPALMASHLPSAPYFFGVWVLAGLSALGGALAYGELGAMFPKAGGDYVFLREAFGPSLAFACGWVVFGAVFTGSIAALAVPLARYQVPALLAPWVALDPDAPLLGLPTQAWIAFSLILLLTLANALGAKLGAWIQNLTTILPAALFGAGALYALTLPPAPHEPSPTPFIPSADALALSYMAAYFAYSGWNAVIYVAGEVRDPQRTLPRSLVLGTASIAALYLLLCAAFWRTLGPHALSQAGEVGTATATAIGGTSAGWLTTLLIAFGLLGTLNGTILGGARVASALAADGAFWKPLAHWSPRATPSRALWLQALWACAFVLTGSFEAILNLVSLAMIVIGSLVVLAVPVLRYTQPTLPRPYKANAYAWLSALYLASNAAVFVVLVLKALRSQTWADASPLFGVLLLALAFVARWLWSRATQPKPAPKVQPKP
jgi:APA family basic amino acid/polyamine antiporter